MAGHSSSSSREVSLLHLPLQHSSHNNEQQQQQHQGMQGLSVAPPPHYIASFVVDHHHQSGYDLGELEQPLSFSINGADHHHQQHQHHHHHQQQQQQQQQQHEFERSKSRDPVSPFASCIFGDTGSIVQQQARNTLNILPAGPIRFDSPNKQQQQPSSQVTSPSGASTDSRFSHYTSPGRGFESSPTSRLDNWGDSRTNENSPRTDTSTDMETNVKSEDGRNQLQQQQTGATPSNHHHNREHKNLDAKALRRLAQNREAARKSRLRKKAYVQQLESSRMKLSQLEQELQRARQQQGFYVGAGGYGEVAGNNAALNPGAAAFDMEYARWLEEQHRQLCELRSALQSHVADNELRVLVDAGLAHYDEIFRMKSVAAKADVFHLVSGMWKSPAERCFMWMGGFRPSELLKILIPQLEPLTEQQLLGICNLQQSSQQAEDALSQGMEALQQSLADTLSSGSLGAASNVANYMGQMAMAMGKLGTLENFVRQADNLRQQTLQQMHRILTTRQAARGLLAMGDYFARLRALSSLWSARPRE